MIAAVWALISSNWKGAVAGIGIGVAAGWLLHKPPPAPAVQAKQETAATQKGATVETIREVTGPVRVVTQTVTKYRDVPRDVPGACPPAPEPLETTTTTTETRDPVTTDTTQREKHSNTEASKTEVKVTPPGSPPRWSVGVGLEDPLGAREIALSAGVRALGPIWVRVNGTPARGLHSGTVGVAVEW